MSLNRRRMSLELSLDCSLVSGELYPPLESSADCFALLHNSSHLLCIACIGILHRVLQLPILITPSKQSLESQPSTPLVSRSPRGKSCQDQGSLKALEIRKAAPQRDPGFSKPAEFALQPKASLKAVLLNPLFHRFSSGEPVFSETQTCGVDATTGETRSESCRAPRPVHERRLQSLRGHCFGHGRTHQWLNEHGFDPQTNKVWLSSCAASS